MTSNTNTRRANKLNGNGSTVQHAEPQVHGLDVWVQLEDDNELYGELTELFRDLNDERGYVADSSKPYYLDDSDLSWADQGVEYGLFSSREAYGRGSGDDHTRYYSQHIQTYTNATEGDIWNG